MYRKGFFVRFVLALVLVAVLAVGGMALFRFGWTQGYQAGVLVAGSAEGEAAPLLPFYRSLARQPFMPGFSFPILACFLGIGFFMLVFILMGSLFRPWRWRRWAGHPHPEGWGHGHRHPPWAREWEEHHKESETEDNDSSEPTEDEK